LNAQAIEVLSLASRVPTNGAKLLAVFAASGLERGSECRDVIPGGQTAHLFVDT
jgi:hypothetical protein